MNEIKSRQRQIAYRARNTQVDKDEVSRLICARIIEQDFYKNAHTIMWYLHCRSEVRTLAAATDQLKTDKTIVIPFCTQDAGGSKVLGLWRLEHIDELEPGTWNILEPPQQRRHEAGKLIRPEQLDLIVVPGVGFDSSGGRLGNGAGYYDRLLQSVRADTVLCGVCYESQLLSRVAMRSHDVFMNKVLTEKAIYSGYRR